MGEEGNLILVLPLVFVFPATFLKRSLDDDIYDRGWGGGTSRMGLYDLEFLCG